MHHSFNIFNMRKPAVKIIAHLDSDLSDLIPGYLRNREKDIKIKIQSIETTGFDEICILAHSMRGSGSCYGFIPISKINEALEESSKIKDLKQIKKHLAVLPDFLERVTLVYN
jgi:hypothetical protein